MTIKVVEDWKPMKLSDLILECLKQGYGVSIDPDPLYLQRVVLSLRYRDLKIEYRFNFREESLIEKESMLALTLERLKSSIKAEFTKEELRKTVEIGEAPYGYCPKCGEVGISRERRPNGNDVCENGHTYPSSEAKFP